MPRFSEVLAVTWTPALSLQWCEETLLHHLLALGHCPPCASLCHNVTAPMSADFSGQVETTATAEASTVARLGQLVEKAAAQRSPLEGAVARFAKYYTPLVLLAAVCIAFIPWAANTNKSHKVCATVAKGFLRYPSQNISVVRRCARCGALHRIFVLGGWSTEETRGLQSCPCLQQPWAGSCCCDHSTGSPMPTLSCV